jgi:calcium permeable stress-gated cation channel
MYQRDRGDDWDARSVSSANILAGGTAEHAVGRASPAPSKMTMSAYDRYLAQGPQAEIEMSRLNVDQIPLLTASQAPGYFDNMASRSNVSLGNYTPYGTPQIPGTPPNPPQVPPMPAMMAANQDYREAALHRPYAPSRQASGYASPGEEINMAGRGAHRAY